MMAEASRWADGEQEALNRAIDAYEHDASYSGAGSAASEQDRWEDIASRVPGRTAEQCLARIQYVTRPPRTVLRTPILTEC